MRHAQKESLQALCYATQDFMQIFHGLHSRPKTFGDWAGKEHSGAIRKLIRHPLIPQATGRLEKGLADLVG